MSQTTDTSAKINFKQAIIVAIITSITTIIVTLISTSGNKSSNTTTETCLGYKSDIEELKSELNHSISAENLSDISNTFFRASDNVTFLKDSLRRVVSLAETHLEDRQHYAYNLFLLKKVLLSKPRGNINTRIDNDDQSTYALIQKILRDIQFYTGPISGNRIETSDALKAFQVQLNNVTEDYFEESNLGILGNKTYIALMEYYERTN